MSARDEYERIVASGDEWDRAKWFDEHAEALLDLVDFLEDEVGVNPKKDLNRLR